MQRKGFRARIALKADDERESTRLYLSLKPEVVRPPSHRSASSIELRGKEIVIEIASPDPTSLRASINGYLRLLKVLEDLSAHVARGKHS